MSDNNESIGQTIAGVAVGIATIIGAATGITGCQSDDVSCQSQQLADSQEIAKRDDDD